jgi:hypothetical protein
MAFRPAAFLFVLFLVILFDLHVCVVTFTATTTTTAAENSFFESSKDSTNFQDISLQAADLVHFEQQEEQESSTSSTSSTLSSSGEIQTESSTSSSLSKSKSEPELESYRDKAHQLAIFMAGGTCSGKTTTKRRVLQEQPHLLDIDTDAIMMNEMVEWNTKSKATEKDLCLAAQLHHLAKEKAIERVHYAIQQHQPFLFDSTLTDSIASQGCDSPNIRLGIGCSAVQWIQLAQQHHFTTHVFITTVEIQQVLEFSVIRAERTMRAVPFEVLVASHRRAAFLFDSLVPYTDVSLYNGFTNTLIAEARNGQRVIVDENAFQAYLKNASLDSHELWTGLPLSLQNRLLPSKYCM